MAKDLSPDLSSAASTAEKGGPSPPWSGHMGGLKIWLVLCLGYLVTTQHQRNNEANKKKTFETNFEKLGKFRKAAIGETNLKSKPKEW